MVDSPVNPLYRVLPRQAESADARQDIKRQEDEGRRRRKEERQEAVTPDGIWEDSTVVSVAALRLFLENLVHGQAPYGSPVASAQHIEIPSENIIPAGAASPARNAAQAYARTYRATHREDTPPVPAPDAPPASPALSPEEQRLIHGLIADLAVLSGKGVQFLTIVKGEGNFLQSLSDAVNMGKLSVS